MFYYSSRLPKGSYGLNNQFADEEHNPLFTNYDSVKFLENEIKLSLEEGQQRKLIKEEIIMSLQILLNNYYDLKLSEHKNSINKYIVEECQNICSIHLNEENVNQLW